MVSDRTIDLARRLKSLHETERPLVLPTVWDAWSARVAADAGFAALTVGSHPLADALGSEDGEAMALSEVLIAVRRITDAVEIPVSVDLESGYGVEPEQLVDGLLEAGGAGVNLEDTVHGEGGRLRSADEHAAFVGAVRAAADARGVPLVINGRTDLFARAEGEPDGLLEEGIARLRALADAGADSLYPVGVQDDERIAALVRALPLPVNITAFPERDDLARLAGLGVRRVSFGPRLQAALAQQASDWLARWR
ncbi:isocitrate lyase/PEP mutase family protein [Patulibacter sp. S7RM1-6]